MADTRFLVDLFLIRFEQNAYVVKASTHANDSDMALAAVKWAEAYGYDPQLKAGALFMVPFPQGRVGVVCVKEEYTFWFMVFEQALFQHIPDPFKIVELLPPKWESRGQLEPLHWSTGYLPPRTTKDARPFLETGDSALLLGTTQALLDGASVSLKREVPATDVVKGVWALLPEQDRAKTWFCTFSVKPMPQLRLSVCVTDDVNTIKLTEEMARDYPEGRYELAMQRAVELGNETEFARLINRRSQKKMLAMLASMVAFILLAMVLLKVLG